jgi:hypothetical protein
MKKSNIFYLIIFILAGLLAYSNPSSAQENIEYGVGEWDFPIPSGRVNYTSLGTQRAVVKVHAEADVVHAHIPWRRRDFNPEDVEVLVYDAASGARIANVFRVDINREYGDLVFQPKTVPGDYYLYYMPFNSSGGPYPKVLYDVPEDIAEKAWIEKNKLTANVDLSSIGKAELVRFEAISDWHSRYPMDVIASQAETKAVLVKNSGKSFLLFTEDRKYPIRMSSDIPQRWIRKDNLNTFSGKADKNEYYVFQVGIMAVESKINNIEITYGDLKSGKNRIPASAITCFNKEGTNWDAKPMTKTISVEKGSIHALWFGVDISEKIKQGTYSGTITVKPEGKESQDITIGIDVSKKVLENRGDNEPWKHSRLRWLNSLYAMNDDIVKPYTALKRDGNSIECLGRKVSLSESGLPSNIESYFSYEMTKLDDKSRKLLNAPMQFVIEKADGENLIIRSDGVKYVDEKAGIIRWEMTGSSDGIEVTCQAKMEFDGYVEYNYQVTSNANIPVNDIRLELPFNSDIARYSMGMGQEGGKCPSNLAWRWDVKNNQDGIWIGDVNAGMQIRFWAENYDRPLNTNFYQSKPLNMPPSWYNNDKGGFLMQKNGNTLNTRVFSGARTLEKGETLNFNFGMLITPFKIIDTKKHFSTRFYHSANPVDSVKVYGANTINLHHANEMNPYINYPFLSVDKLKARVKEAHDENMRLKLYYTVRELTAHAPEVHAILSLDGEIFSQRKPSENKRNYGTNGGYPWLQEHLDSTYMAAWFSNSQECPAIVNTGVSRWHNYYVEGMNWLVDNIGIDGIYIDDLAFDRTTMKRIRKVLDKRPDPFIDLHSANQFNYNDGFVNSAFLYLEHFPYLDRLWFGEYFKYENKPDYWMVEVSGLPYGLMGEMLQDGGNLYRGMIYGMTNRAPRNDPRPIWKIWDDFGIAESRMLGYWVPYCPVKTDRDDVKATVYQRQGKALVSVASWADNIINAKLTIDWEALGIDSESAELYAPAIDGFQPEKTWKPDDTIAISKGKGYLIIIRKNK